MQQFIEWFDLATSAICSAIQIEKLRWLTSTYSNAPDNTRLDGLVRKHLATAA